MPWLINAAQLDKLRKDQKNVVIFDASWHLTSEGRNPAAEFEKNHIVGARFLDLDSFHEATALPPNMLIRDENLIHEKMSALGITADQKIIFYDNSKLHTSCRALWMFKVFGHSPNLLYVLDGGYEAWERYGGKIEIDAVRAVSAKPYDINFQAHFLRSLMQMKTNLHHPMEQVVDVRHPVRYVGGAEARPNLRAGHIPGSFCYPYFSLFEADGRFKSLDKIRKQLTGLGIDLNVPIVTTCGSGMTASIMNFVLDLLNHTENSLYDGSWSEWGWDQLYPGEESVNERPVVTSLE